MRQMNRAFVIKILKWHNSHKSSVLCHQNFGTLMQCFRRHSKLWPCPLLWERSVFTLVVPRACVFRDDKTKVTPNFCRNTGNRSRNHGGSVRIVQGLKDQDEAADDHSRGSRARSHLSGHSTNDCGPRARVHIMGSQSPQIRWACPVRYAYLSVGKEKYSQKYFAVESVSVKCTKKLCVACPDYSTFYICLSMVLQAWGLSCWLGWLRTVVWWVIR